VSEQPRLINRYLIFPTSVIDRRSQRWRDLRRDHAVTDDSTRDGALYAESSHPVGRELYTYSDGASRFDPALARLLVHWYTTTGDHVIDPFAGGPTRGVTAAAMGRTYLGIDIRPDQIAAQPVTEGACWQVGDATRHEWGPADAVLTCPPYGPLERYSDDPRDLSTMAPAAFADALTESARRAAGALREDRFSLWVVGDYRHRDGSLASLIPAVVEGHRQAGCTWIDDLIVVDPVGAGRLRAKRPWVRGRLTLRTHQHVLVFVTGDRREAAWRIYDGMDVPAKKWKREGAR
jgi:hypothetical protein